MKSEQDARRRIEQIFAAVSEIGEAGLQLPRPHQASQISRDDARFSLLATSHLATGSMASAHEHLFAAAQIWHTHPGGFLLPTAYSTLLRSTLVGASNALYVLAPKDQDERTLHTVQLAEENFRHALVIQEEALAAAPQVPLAPEVAVQGQRQNIALARRRLAEATAMRRQLSGKTFNQTTAVRYALRAAYPSDPLLQIHGVYLWRTQSGDAHALPWPKLQRAIQTGTRNDLIENGDGTVELRDIHTAESFFPLLAAAWMLSKAAREFYENLRLPATVSNPS